MQLNPSDPKVRLAVLGQQVDDFLHSDIGMYLLQCAELETDSAARAMMDVDPTDVPKIIAIQVKLKAAAWVESWLRQAISAGLQAFQVEELE
jgi:hypothetical protein